MEHGLLQCPSVSLSIKLLQMPLNNGCSDIVLINAKSHVAINVARHVVDQNESGKAKRARGSS